MPEFKEATGVPEIVGAVFTGAGAGSGVGAGVGSGVGSGVGAGAGVDVVVDVEDDEGVDVSAEGVEEEDEELPVEGVDGGVETLAVLFWLDPLESPEPPLPPPQPARTAPASHISAHGLALFPKVRVLLPTIVVSCSLRSAFWPVTGRTERRQKCRDDDEALITVGFHRQPRYLWSMDPKTGGFASPPFGGFANHFFNSTVQSVKKIVPGQHEPTLYPSGRKGWDFSYGLIARIRG